MTVLWDAPLHKRRATRYGGLRLLWVLRGRARNPVALSGSTSKINVAGSESTENAALLCGLERPGRPRCEQHPQIGADVADPSAYLVAGRTPWGPECTTVGPAPVAQFRGARRSRRKPFPTNLP